MSMTAGLAIAWLSAALLAGEPADAKVVGDQLGEILEHERYAFCSVDNDFSPSSDDQRWCELAAASDFEHCPGYAEICQQDLESVDSAVAEPGEVTGEGGPNQPGEANQNARTEFELPNLGAFAKILMWLLLIGMATGIAYLIGKNLVRGRERDEPEPDADPEAGESLIAARAAALRVVETDVQRLLARAEQAAGRGEHEPAIHDVYAALLRRLEGEQLIAVDQWKTNGDYIHDLRPRPALRDETREIIRAVEQVQFGAAPAEASRYRDIRAKVVAIVSRTSLAFALLLGGATQLGCPSEPPDSSALAGLGTGPSGKRAVGELLLTNGIEARHRTRTIEQLAQTGGAIVLLDDVELLEEDWDTLIAWVEEDGGTLVIATGRDFPRELGVDYASFNDELGQALALQPGQDQPLLSGLSIVAPAGRVLQLRVGALTRSDDLLVRVPASVEGSADRPPGARPYVIRRPLGTPGDEQGQIVVFAEPDMLTNAGISVANNGAFLVNLFRSLDIDEVEFVDRYTGAGPDNPFESVGNAKLGALFLQILLFLALLYAAVGIPFARLRDPAQQRRRSFSEHVKTLGQRYAQARAARHVAGLYSAWALDRMRDRLRPGAARGAARGLHPLAVAIAARTGRDEGHVMALLVSANDLRGPANSPTRGGAAELELMRALAKLLDETGSAR